MFICYIFVYLYYCIVLLYHLLYIYGCRVFDCGGLGDGWEVSGVLVEAEEGGKAKLEIHHCIKYEQYHPFTPRDNRPIPNPIKNPAKDTAQASTPPPPIKHFLRGKTLDKQGDSDESIFGELLITGFVVLALWEILEGVWYGLVWHEGDEA